MKILIHTDHNIDGNAAFSERVETGLTDSLARFSDRLTRVEAHLRDESAGRTTGDDVRCMLEARPAGAEPVTVTHHGDTPEQAIDGSVEKLVTLLSSKFDRQEGHHSRDTIRHRR